MYENTNIPVQIQKAHIAIWEKLISEELVKYNLIFVNQQMVVALVLKMCFEKSIMRKDMALMIELSAHCKSAVEFLKNMKKLYVFAKGYEYRDVLEK